MQEKVYRVCTDSLTMGFVQGEDLSGDVEYKKWFWNLTGDGHHAYFKSENEAKDALRRVLQRNIQWLQEKLQSLDIKGD